MLPMPDPLAPSRTVLYAEDDADDAFFMRRAFVKMDAAVALQIVPHGQAAIDYLLGAGDYADRDRHPLPMLLLLDVKMPERSGLEVLSWVRAQAEFAALPVVMFTSSAQETDIDRSRQLGANAYLVKPSNATGLHVLMKAVLDAFDADPTARDFPIKENLLAGPVESGKALRTRTD